MTGEQYKKSVASVSNDLMRHLDEGIRMTDKAIKNRMEPKFEAPEKPGTNAGVKAMSIYNYKTKALVKKKSE